LHEDCAVEVYIDKVGLLAGEWEWVGGFFSFFGCVPEKQTIFLVEGAILVILCGVCGENEGAE
jgi:hypothetical protein